jgi:hypothetical protein
VNEYTIDPYFNPQITEGRDLPWLQDTEEVDGTGAWAAAYRDVVVIDGDRNVIDVYNLTNNDLADASNYDTLDQILRNAAK